MVFGELTPVRVSESRTRVRRLIRGWGLAVRSRGAGTRGGRDQWVDGGGWRGGWQCGGGVWDGRCAPAVTSRHHRKPHHPWGPGGNTLQVGPSHTLAVGDTQQFRDHKLYDHCRSVDTLLALLGYLFKHINLLSRVAANCVHRDPPIVKLNL